MDNRRGAISLWYIIILTSLVTLFGVSMHYLNIQAQTNHLKRQAERLVHNVANQYDTSLLMDYGLLANTSSDRLTSLSENIKWLNRHDTTYRRGSSRKLQGDLTTRQTFEDIQALSGQMQDAASIQLTEQVVASLADRGKDWLKADKTGDFLKQLQKGFDLLGPVEKLNQEAGQLINHLHGQDLQIHTWIDKAGQVRMDTNLGDLLQKAGEIEDLISKAHLDLRAFETYMDQLTLQAHKEKDALLPEVFEALEQQARATPVMETLNQMDGWLTSLRAYRKDLEGLQDQVRQVTQVEEARVIEKRASGLFLQATFQPRGHSKIALAQVEDLESKAGNKGVTKEVSDVETPTNKPSEVVSDQVDVSLADSVLLTEYIMGSFLHRESNEEGGNGPRDWDFYGKHHRSFYVKNEVEYVAMGGDLSEAQWRFNLWLSACRMTTNLIHVYTCQEKQTLASELAGLAAVTGIGVPLVYNGVLFAWASIETAQDLQRLDDGESVALLKLSDQDWSTSLKGKAPFPDKSRGDREKLKAIKALNQWYYCDFLRLKLNMTGATDRTARAMDIIWMNDQGLAVADYTTGWQLDLRLVDTRGETLLKESQELTYGH